MEILCPNCHAITDTYRGKNKGVNKGLPKKKKTERRNGGRQDGKPVERPIKIKICGYCKNEFEVNGLSEYGRKYCSVKCNNLAQDRRYALEHKKCLYCKKPFESQNYYQKYCSYKCAHKDSHKVKHPSKEELQNLVWEKPTTHIAKDFGVSDKAIEKWCKKYGIEKPPRGYWAKKKAGKI